MLTNQNIFDIFILVTITIIKVINMKQLKYSRQREAIISFLATRKDHPTADIVYEHIRNEYPNISLGTVYRNLALLSEIGEITKLSYGNGADHFDGNTTPHYHFVCTECNAVSDIELSSVPDFTQFTDSCFSGNIAGYCLHFYGKCAACK